MSRGKPLTVIQPESRWRHNLMLNMPVSNADHPRIPSELARSLEAERVGLDRHWRITIRRGYGPANAHEPTTSSMARLEQLVGPLRGWYMHWPAT